MKVLSGRQHFLRKTWVDNLFVIIDYNKMQSYGTVDSVISLEPINENGVVLVSAFIMLTAILLRSYKLFLKKSDEMNQYLRNYLSYRQGVDFLSPKQSPLASQATFWR